MSWLSAKNTSGCPKRPDLTMLPAPQVAELYHTSGLLPTHKVAGGSDAVGFNQPTLILTHSRQCMIAFEINT